MDQSKPRPSSTALIGKGGVGLVMFHLARLGIEFVETTPDSIHADLWMRFPDGRMLVAEVKASFHRQWQIGRSQATTADLFFFVEMQSGRLHILTRDQVADVIAATRQKGKAVSITKTQLPPDAEANWALLGGTEAKALAPKALVLQPEPAPTGRFRTVKRVLADGSVKEYTYAEKRRHFSRNGKRREIAVSGANPLAEQVV